MKNKFAVYIAAIITVILWGMSYIWSDRLLALNIPVEFFLPIRILLAAILLFVYNLLTKKDMRLNKKAFYKFIILALCMPFIYFFAETYGLQFTESPTITSLIIATNPIFSMLVGMLLFKEHFSAMNIAGVFITLAGLWLVTYTHTETGPMFAIGIVVLFIAVVAEVSQLAFTKSLSAHFAPSVIVMYQFLFGSVFFLPLFLTKGLAGFDASLYFSWDVIYPTISLAVLCGAGAFTLWAFAIKHLGVAKISVFLAIVPLATALLSFFVGDERLCLFQWCGLAIGMVGIYMTQVLSKKHKAQ